MPLNKTVIFFVLFIFFTACKKDKAPESLIEPPAPDMSWPLLIPAEMKEYVDFKVGSYWIYRDSITGQEDSVYVTDYENKLDTTSSHIHYKWGVFEWIKVIKKSSRSGYYYYTYVHTGRSGWYPDYFPFRHKLEVEKYKPGDFVGADVLFEYPIITGHILYVSDYPNDEITTSKFFLSMIMDSITYPSVVEVHNTHSTIEGHGPTETYFAKNIGIIKQEIPDSVLTWKLVRYHVVK